jgi:capsular exopolysaccharide synthesis family protein
MAQSRLLDQPVAAEEPQAAPAFSLWEMLWRRKAYVALGAAVGVVLGVIYYSMTPRTYESTAQILVMKKRPADTPISAAAGVSNQSGFGGAGLVEDFLDTHRAVVRSAVVISNAVEKKGLADLDAFRESPAPAKDIAQSLTVARDRDKLVGGQSHSQILNVAFRCGVADDCGTVLNAILASYQEFLNSSNQGSAKEALELFTKARNLVQNDLEQKEKAYAEFRKNTPVLWKTATGSTLYMERLGNIDAERAALTMRMAQINATLAAVDEAVKKGRSRAELLEIISALPGRSGAMVRGPLGLARPNPLDAIANEGTSTSYQGGLEQELVQLQLQEGKLLQDYGPQHPQVLSLRDRMQTIRGLLAPTTTPQGQTPEQRRQDDRAKENVVDLKIGQLRQEMAELRRNGASLDKLFKKELEEAKEAFPYETQEDAFRHSIDRSQTLYDNVIKRLEEMDLISNFGGYDAQVITPPTEPEKVSPRGSLVFPVALLLGLVLGTGLAYLVEQTDTSFRSPEDIRRRLGLPIMGLIPVVKQDPAAFQKVAAGEVLLDPSMCAFYRPKSKDAEAYRGVRTALYFSTRGAGHKVIQVTSPNAYDGKSTLAANLAISIAQSGKKILLVDADLRRPRVDKIFGVPNEVGFSSVLAGLAEPADVIQQTPVPGLYLLPGGPLPPNPAELLTSSRFPDLIAWMRDNYDYVLIDTPPLLAVSDPSVVGPRVDGVILTLRPSKKSRLEADRAKEILSTLQVNVFGVVVNAVAVKNSSYSYGYYYDTKSGYYQEEGPSGTAEGEAGSGSAGNGQPVAGA